MIVSELERLSAESESDWIEGKDGEAGILWFRFFLSD